MLNRTLVLGCAAMLLTGCQTRPGPVSDRRHAPSDIALGAGQAGAVYSTASPPAQPPANGALAMLDGRMVAVEAVLPALLEAAGGQVLAEHVLDVRLAQRLAQQGLRVDASHIDAERQLLLANLSADKDQALRLLDELRAVRGLGPVRFESLLVRNATLRLLVEDQVSVSEEALQQEFTLRFGPRYQGRIIVVDTLHEAADLLRRVRAGGSFVDLATAHSVDSSRAQGGLLAAISPADATYPAAVRQALAQLEAGAVSDPVALDRGYALLRLERKIEPAAVRFDDVKADLSRAVRRQAQRMLMDQLARTMLAQADLVIFDRALERSYARQRQAPGE